MRRWRSAVAARAGAATLSSGYTGHDILLRWSAGAYLPVLPARGIPPPLKMGKSRTQVMIEHMHPRGVAPEKVWAFKQDADPLAPPRLMPSYDDGHPIPGASGASVEWTYHVAPVVLVEGSGGETRPLVIDPSLSRTRLAGPISINAWHHLVGTPAGGFRDQTVLGQAPLNPYTGGRYVGDGYLPGLPTAHQADARGFMRAVMMGGTGPSRLTRPARPLPAL